MITVKEFESMFFRGIMGKRGTFVESCDRGKNEIALGRMEISAAGIASKCPFRSAVAFDRGKPERIAQQLRERFDAQRSFRKEIRFKF